MRLVVNLFVVLGALCLFAGTIVALVGRAGMYRLVGGILPYWNPETWWRGAVALLLLAITLLLLERRGRA
jgi:hypothetical protein